jgi:hypothetical protein
MFKLLLEMAKVRGESVMDREPLVAPFVAALGQALERAAPSVRRHLALAGHEAVHRGAIRRMWRRGPLGSVGGRLLHLGGPGIADSRFELHNEIVPDARGGSAMVWRRTHYVNSEPVSGIGLLRWDATRRVLVDEIGERRWLEVELTPRLDGRSVTMRSGRQWLHVAGLRLRMPRLVVGGARTREWEEPDGRLGLSLTLHHPLFGDYAGYEVVFAPGNTS